ncbi:MAG TPA: hypothetical protein VE221_03105, partial [Sphingomicrobium sp.]|nr:hypothetical protein [Sphingomicrobium sp.]
MKLLRLLPLLLLAVGACHQNLEMSDQRKLQLWERTTLFRNGRVAQAPPAASIAREDDTGDILAEKPPMSLALVARGRERFNVFCSECHGPAGDA